MSNTINATKLIQNDKDILLFSIEGSELANIALYKQHESGDRESIQRKFDIQRSRKISSELKLKRLFMPNSIVINLDLETNNLNIEDIYTDGKLNWNIIKDKLKAFVIDGQHRLRAFEYYNESYDVVVSAYINLSLAEIADIFIQINYNQKPVNKSLVYDLLGINKSINPEFFIYHNVVEKLNTFEDSPFFNSIKMLGYGDGLISQSSLISAIDKYKLSKNLKNFGLDPTEDNLFAILFFYFKAVKKHFESAWMNKTPLVKSAGMKAMVLLIQDVIILIDTEINETSINSIIKKIPNNFWDNMIVPGGEAGVQYIYKKLKEFLVENEQIS